MGDALGVSDAVAEAVGEAVGVQVGDSLGLALGDGVNEGDGDDVALADGDAVGVCDVAAETVGEAVGVVDALGMAIGDPVTSGVGVLAVGDESLPLEHPASSHAKAKDARRALDSRIAIMSFGQTSPVWPDGAMNYKADPRGSA